MNAYHAMEDTGGKLEVNLSEVDIEIEPTGKIRLKPSTQKSCQVERREKTLRKNTSG